MIQNKFVFLTLVILLLLGMNNRMMPDEDQLPIAEQYRNKMADSPRTPPQKVTSTQSYIERGPISITSNFQLNNSGFQGNGTIDDPIRIEGYNITDSGGILISISGTTFYFQITNCLLNGMSTSDNGISLQNVIHGTIANNTIYGNNWDGIFLYNSDYNLLDNNTIYDNNKNGIVLNLANNNTITTNTASGNTEDGIFITSQSHDNTILGNTVYSNNEGIGIGDHSENNTIIANTAYNNDQDGIIIAESSANNTITYNTAHSNLVGIWILSGDFNTISNNEISNNINFGILVGSIDANNNTISRNLIFDNIGSGITMRPEATENYVQENDFSGNYGGNTQAYDEGLTNLFLNNYWSDWTGTGSYVIVGSAGNQDPSPLTNPYHLLVPIITAPTTENLTLTGIISFQWNASSDVFSHSLTYSVFYSINAGTSWTSLASGLTVTNYALDTTLIANGPVIFKVQVTDSIGFIAKAKTEETFLIANDQPSTPTIISPNGGETLNETITIEWTASLDSFDHSITYTIYSSADNGATWTQVATGLTTTSYVWDTTTVPNGFSYLIKVVATCSEGITSEDLSDELFTIQNELPSTTETSSTTTTPIPGITALVLLVAMFTLIARRKNW
ncbi:MAG: right-handed parallel beta-helix repeat-containing protein [Candidatus Hodarchaeales archaeon]